MNSDASEVIDDSEEDDDSGDGEGWSTSSEELGDEDCSKDEIAKRKKKFEDDLERMAIIQTSKMTKGERLAKKGEAVLRMPVAKRKKTSKKKAVRMDKENDATLELVRQFLSKQDVNWTMETALKDNTSVLVQKKKGMESITFLKGLTKWRNDFANGTATGLLRTEAIKEMSLELYKGVVAVCFFPLSICSINHSCMSGTYTHSLPTQVSLNEFQSEEMNANVRIKKAKSEGRRFTKSTHHATYSPLNSSVTYKLPYADMEVPGEVLSKELQVSHAKLRLSLIKVDRLIANLEKAAAAPKSIILQD
jgi:hypothetical protein